MIFSKSTKQFFHFALNWGFNMKPVNLFFDYYECGIERSLSEVGQFMLTVASYYDRDSCWRLERCSNLYGYEKSFYVTNGMVNYCRIMAGGNTGSAIYVKSSGVHAESAAQAIRDNFPSEHIVMRCDVACDLLPHEKDFNYYSGLLSRVAQEIGVKTGCQGDWATCRSGRTLYVGSRLSTSMLRFYEKGKQLQIDDDVLRFEMEVKADKPEQKRKVALMTKEQIFCTSKIGVFTYELLTGINSDLFTCSSPTEQTSKDKALRHCIKQYRSTLFYFSKNKPDFWDWFRGEVMKMEV